MTDGLDRLADSKFGSLTAEGQLAREMRVHREQIKDLQEKVESLEERLEQVLALLAEWD